MTPSPQPVRVLHLTIKRQWFDMIASGEKTTEYREMKPYWSRRFYGSCKFLLFPIRFDEVHFRNGYGKSAPFMRVKWLALGTDFDSPIGPQLVYAIRLGEILEVRR